MDEKLGGMMNTTEHGVEVRKKIKKAIIWYIEQHGYAPTIREIGEMVGLSSRILFFISGLGTDRFHFFRRDIRTVL